MCHSCKGQNCPEPLECQLLGSHTKQYKTKQTKRAPLPSSGFTTSLNGTTIHPVIVSKPCLSTVVPLCFRSTSSLLLPQCPNPIWIWPAPCQIHHLRIKTKPLPRAHSALSTSPRSLLSSTSSASYAPGPWPTLLLQARHSFLGSCPVSPHLVSALGSSLQRDFIYDGNFQQ